LIFETCPHFPTTTFAFSGSFQKLDFAPNPFS
jgi:hypothetical protein